MKQFNEKNETIKCPQCRHDDLDFHHFKGKGIFECNNCRHKFAKDAKPAKGNVLTKGVMVRFWGD